MNYLDCPLKYIGQTVVTFNIIYKEYIHAIRINNINSGYSNHILNAEHTYESITDTMDGIRTRRNDRHLNILENIIPMKSIGTTFIWTTYTSIHTTSYLRYYTNCTTDSSTQSPLNVYYIRGKNHTERP
jgi:hypothetical protein